MGVDLCRSFAAWSVQSDFALTELPLAIGAADWRIRHDPTASSRRHVIWYQQADAIDGLPWVWFGRRGAADVVRFPGLGWCAFDTGSDHIGCAWRKHLQIEDTDHLLVNHLLPLAASRAGFLVLHASVVVRPGGGAVAFAGRTGAGKSTAALALASRGWEVLSDDRLLIDPRGMAHAIAPSIRVSPEAAAHFGFHAALPPHHRKVKLRAHEHGFIFRSVPAPLERVVFIDQANKPTTASPIRGREASLAVLTALLQLGLDRPEVQKRVFARVAEVIASAAITRLQLAKQWERLSEIEGALEGA